MSCYCHGSVLVICFSVWTQLCSPRQSEPFPVRSQSWWTGALQSPGSSGPHSATLRKNLHSNRIPQVLLNTILRSPSLGHFSIACEQGKHTHPSSHLLQFGLFSKCLVVSCSGWSDAESRLRTDWIVLRIGIMMIQCFNPQDKSVLQAQRCWLIDRGVEELINTLSL